MTKSELVKAVAEEVGITQADTERILKGLVWMISEALQVEGRFELGGFGVFTKKQRAEVTRPNPQNREQKITTPARNTITFKPSPALKALVNQ